MPAFSANTLTRSTLRSRMRGFTLIEIAVFIIVAGALTAGAVSFAIPTIKSARIIETQSKMRKIQTALHSYVMTNYRLPCPGFPNRVAGAFPNDPPFGFERASGPTGDLIPDNCTNTNANWSGIIPYRTLGLGEEDVIDGWGNFISYHVSPAFAQNTTNALPVFAQCRTPDWLYEDGINYEQVRNRNPVKARFCCPGNAYAANTDWVVVDENATPVLTGAGAGNAFTSRSTDGNLYEPLADTPYPDPIEPDTPVPADEKATGVAYVLISHGESNGGAFNVRTGNRFPFREANNLDSENNSADRVLVKPTRPTIQAGGALVSDDLIIWDTQDTIMSSIGQSCALP